MPITLELYGRQITFVSSKVQCNYQNCHCVVFKLQPERKTCHVCRILPRHTSVPCIGYFHAIKAACVHRVLPHISHGVHYVGVQYHADSLSVLFIHGDTLFWIISRKRQIHSGTFTYSKMCLHMRQYIQKFGVNLSVIY